MNQEDVEGSVEEHRTQLLTGELLALHDEEAEILKCSLTSKESEEDEDKVQSYVIPTHELKDVFWC